jgi:hypothetical protein
MFLIFGIFNYETDILLAFIENIFKNNTKYQSQISITAGVQFKTQLVKYGGEGYCKYFNFIKLLQKRSSLTNDCIKKIT